MSNGATPRPGRRLTGSAADAALVAALVAMVCIPVWPGVFNPDSQFMLLAARNKTISNYYAPLHGWVWGLLDRAGVPPGIVFLISVAGFVTAVLALVKQFLRERAARVTTAVVVLFPPIYGLLGLVGRDVWFATAAVAITACAWDVLRRPGRLSAGRAAGLLLFAGIAADSRQNGAPFAALAVGLVVFEWLRRARPSASTATRAGAATVAVALFFGGILVAQRLVVTERLHPEQNLYAGDLIGVSLVRGELLFDVVLFPSQDLDLLRARLGSIDLGTVLYADPPIVSYRNNDGRINGEWARQWRTMLSDHPAEYLVWRGKLFLAQLGITHGVRYPYFGGSAQLPNGLGPSVSNVFPSAVEARNDLLGTFNGPSGTGSFLVVPVWYLLITGFSLASLGRSAERGAAVAVLLVVLAMQGLLFFSAPGTEYRLEYFQVVLGTAFGSIAVARELEQQRRRRTGRLTAPIPPTTTAL